MSFDETDQREQKSKFRYEGPYEIVLVDLGDDPQAVAAVLKEFMSLTVPNVGALTEALPLRLYDSLEQKKTEALCHHLRMAGASIERRVPRERLAGIRRPFSPGGEAP